MNINSVSSADQVSALNQVSNQTTNTPSSLPPPGIGDAAVPQMSGPGKLMSKLAALKEADPSKFQSVVSDMAAKFKQLASQATGPQAQFFANLSNKLGDIAHGGDIAQLAPSGGAQAGGPHGAHHGGHHHHHGGGGLGGVGSSSDSSDSSESSVQSVAESIFGELDSALNGATSSSSST